MPHWFPTPILAIILGAFAVALIVAWIKKQREVRRLEDLIAWAAGRGFTVAAGPKSTADAGLAPELTALPLFSRGRRQRVRNLIRGTTPEGALLLFDVRYVVQSGKHTTSIEQTVAAFERASPLPAFELRPEGFLSRLGQAFGLPDINLVESHPEFSRQYQLHGPDTAALRRLFEGQLATYLAHTKGWSIQAGGSWLIVFRHDTRPAVAQLSEYLETVGAIVRMFRQG